MLPPHILKYQKQLNELNKITTNNNAEKQPSKNTQKNKNKNFKNNSKNTQNKDFLQPKNRTNTISLTESPPQSPNNSLQTDQITKNDEMTKNWKIYRKGAGVIWEDESLNEWPDNDYRIFVGDLGNEVNDQTLTNAFMKYQSFNKAKVVRNRITGKTRGYGFVSIMDVNDYISAMKEMDGKYVGNRPIKLKRSTWKDRSVLYSKSKVNNVTCIKKKRNKKEKEEIKKEGEEICCPIADDVTNLLNINLDINSLVNKK